MAYRSHLSRILYSSLNPYSLLACCTIFLVVRSEDAEDGAVNQQGQSIDNQILGTLLDEASLANVGRCNDIVLRPKVVDAIELAAVVDVAKPVLHDDDVPGLFDDVVDRWTPLVEKVQNEMCRKHGRLFLRHLRRYKMWAMQMFDSSAKLPSSILRGNTNQLGDFDQCLDVTVATSESATTPLIGQYCLVQVDVATPGEGQLDDAVSRAQGLGFITSTLDDPGHFIPQFTTINWAVCLPSSCPSDDLEAAMVTALHTTPGLEFHVRADPNMCYIKESRPLTRASLMAICFFGIVALLAVVASVMDCGTSLNTRSNGKLTRLLLCFSLQRNWAALWADLPEGDIHCIHGVRAVCTVMLYAGHKVIPLALTPITNRVRLTELSFLPLSILLRTSLIYTDSFLLLSGVLTAYNLSKEMHRTMKIEWGKRYAARFIRLTPALFALVLFYAYVMEHLGSGPLWNRVIKQNADICKDNMWTNILYIQNFFPFQQMCATHTHQLALDMQLSFITPLLVYLLYKHHLLGVLLLIVLHISTAALRFFVTLHNNLSLVIYHGMPLSQLYLTANLSYSLSTHRATPYLVGVGIGYFLYKYEKSIHIPKWSAALCWLAAAACVYASIIAPSHVAHQNFEYDPLEAAVYAAYSSVTWSLALGWLICACSLGHCGWLNKMLSWTGMVFMSKISYSFYLTQFAVFFYNIGTLRSSQEFLLTKLVSVEEFAFVIVVSIVMTLLFDLPMQELKGILTSKGPRTMDSKKQH